jgi:hypothetical protein
MDHFTLTEKFLVLGESGKNFDGSIGGFGKAKSLICYCHDSWAIRTGSFRVTGCGGDYELSDGLEYFHGTSTVISTSLWSVDKLVSQVECFIAYAQWSGRIILNGVAYKCDLRKGSPRRELPFGVVYTNKSYKNRLIVRMNGIPMFSSYVGLDRCVIVELSGKSIDCLTSNRDGLKYPYSSQLSDFITSLAVDKRSALKQSTTRYRHYAGPKLSVLDVKDIVEGVEAPDESPLQAVPGESLDVDAGDNSCSQRVGGSGPIVCADEPTVGSGGRGTVVHGSVSRATIGQDFVVKNQTDLEIPSYYLPDSSQFSSYSLKLVRFWGRVLLQLHKLFESNGEFSIGFVFDEDAVAQFESGKYGFVYYLNPARVVTQVSSNSRSFKKRFKLTDRDALIAVAAHEYVHSLGFDIHDESYASKFTYVFERVLAARKSFNWCFR